MDVSTEVVAAGVDALLGLDVRRASRCTPSARLVTKCAFSLMSPAGLWRSIAGLCASTRDEGETEVFGVLVNLPQSPTIVGAWVVSVEAAET